MKPELKKRKAPPFPFVLEALGNVDYHTKPMFGCLAVYVGEKIMLILRDKEKETSANGIWVGTEVEHHPSLRADFPSLTHLKIFGPGPTTWQLLPVKAPDFESSALQICELIGRGDPRIGRVPNQKKKKAAKPAPGKRPIRRRK